jgi:hypothetical protein
VDGDQTCVGLNAYTQAIVKMWLSGKPWAGHEFPQNAIMRLFATQIDRASDDDQRHSQD